MNKKNLTHIPIFFFITTILLQTLSISPMKLQLHKACIKGDIEVIKSFIKKDLKEFEREDPYGNTPLDIAYLYNKKEIAKYIIKECKGKHKYFFRDACRKGNLKAIKYFIEKLDHNPNEKFCKTYQDPTTIICCDRPIHVACENGHLDVVKYFIEEKNIKLFDLRGLLIENSQMNNPIFIACKKGYKEIIKFFETKSFFSLARNSYHNSRGHTLLMLACMNKNLEMVKFLVEELKEDINVVVNMKKKPFNQDINNPYHKKDALQLSIELFYSEKKSENKIAYLEIAKYLLTQKEQKLKNHIDPFGSTIKNAFGGWNKLLSVGHTFFPIAELIKTMEIKQLLQTDDNGNNPLDIACLDDVVEKELHSSFGSTKKRIHISPAKHLAKRMKNLNICPLYEACKNGKLQTVKTLIEELHYSLEKKYELGYTPAHVACSYGQLEVVKYLIEKQKIKRYIKTKSGENLLDIAIMNKKKNLAKYLANSDHLFWACQCGNIKKFIYLTKELKMLPHKKYHRNNIKRSLLHIACQYGKLNIVKHFIEKLKFNIEAKDSENKTPIEYAHKNNHLHIVKYLKSKGAIDYFKNTRNDYWCPIAYKYFKENQQIAVLPCNHMFYPETISSLRKKECPICKIKFQKKQIQKKLFRKIKIKDLKRNESSITIKKLKKIGYSKKEIESLK